MGAESITDIMIGKEARMFALFRIRAFIYGTSYILDGQ